MKPTLYVLLACKSTNEYTTLAVDSFLKNTILNKDDQFIVIDNDGIDIPCNTVKVIHNDIPQTFAKNSNTAIELANGRNVIVLSNDVVFPLKWNEFLNHYDNMLLLPSCNQTQTYTVSNLSLTHTMNIREYGNNHNLLNIISRYHINLTQSVFFETLLMSFYVFRLSETVYNQVGLLDERFGIAGGEDIDYRVRSIILNIPVKFYNKSYLLHFGGKSTWDGPETAMDIQNRNVQYRDKFVQKWGEDLAELLLVGGNYFQIIQKYNLNELYETNNFSKIIQIVYESSRN